MPKMSDTMEEGVIASWLVKVGDKVAAGDILAEVETDKATMDLESYEDGVLLHIGVAEKQAVPINGVLAIIGEEGEDITALLQTLKTTSPSPKKAAVELAEVSESVPMVQEDIDVSAIAATVVRMPKMSDTMTEGLISTWLVKQGDEVSAGDILAEVETDKATMELECYEDGVMLYIGVAEKEAVPVDGIIAIIGEKDADWQSLLRAEENNKAQNNNLPPQKTVSSPDMRASSEKMPEVAPAATGRIKASPLAKKMAAEKGFDLSQIQGTGENGRIIKRDIESFKPLAAAPQKIDKTAEKTPVLPPFSASGKESYTEETLSQMRKTIARRLAESKFTSPHFYLTMEIDMGKIVEARKGMNTLSPVKISFNDIIIKAAALALRQNPKVNASWLGDKIRYHNHIHIGVAVAVEEGLLVPVVRFADQKSISRISAEVKDLGAKAKSKKLQPADWEGNTFTISNLGMFGIEEFTAIINPPDACILAVGGIKQTPLVKEGEIVIGHLMKVTLSCDHRVVDGAVGSAFLQSLKQLLENPLAMLV